MYERLRAATDRIEASGPDSITVAATALAYADDYDWNEMKPVLAAAERSMQAFPTAIARVEQTILAIIEECERGQ